MGMETIQARWVNIKTNLHKPLRSPAHYSKKINATFWRSSPMTSGACGKHYNFLFKLPLSVVGLALPRLASECRRTLSRSQSEQGTPGSLPFKLLTENQHSNCYECSTDDYHRPSLCFGLETKLSHKSHQFPAKLTHHCPKWESLLTQVTCLVLPSGLHWFPLKIKT